MSKELVRLYRKFREHSPFMLVGENARLALDAARTLAEWEQLEQAGLVTIEATPDQDYRVHDYHSDKCTREHPCSECHYVELWGVWDVVTEWLTSTDDEFETADSICGCVYNDPCSPYENCYVIDMMRAAIDAYHNAAIAANI